MDLRHLKLASGMGLNLEAASASGTSEMCLLDYAHCSTSDTCWIMDLGSGCSNHDGCIIDTN
jgi:hypothetical protein